MTQGRKPRSPKKPLSKKVQNLIAELTRKSGTRDLPKRFLIVCEDGKSSVNYFNALRKHLGLSAASVMVAPSDNGRTQPIQVVDRAIQIQKQASREPDPSRHFAHAWCVIDGDFGHDKIQRARGRANANAIELAISTPCFEYWVVLHFEEFSRTNLNCDGMEQRVKKRLPSYEKGKTDFRKVVPMYGDACRRAKQQRQHQANVLPERQDPCSESNRLIDALGVPGGSAGERRPL